MRSEFRTVGRHTLVYGTGVVLGQLASFLMLPVYTRYLSAADYGVLELLGMTIDVIGMIMGVGLAAGVFKFYSELSDPAEKRQVVSTVALGSIGLAFVTSMLGIVLAGPLNQLVFQGETSAHYFRVFFLAYFLQTAGAPALLLMRIQERSVLFVVVNLCKLILSLSLNIYFVVMREMGLEGVLLSTVIVSGALGLVLVVYTFHHVGLSFSLTRFRQMSRFGAPLIVVSLGSFVLTFSDRYFLNYYSDTSAVGVYGLAYRFSFVLSTLTVIPFQQIWEPRRFEVAKRPDAGDIYRRMFFYSSLALLGGATFMTAVIEDVLTLMVAPEFLPAHRVVPLILVATVLQQWAAYCSLGLYLRDRTQFLAWASLAAVVVALALNALLIPRFGVMGAAWATIGAYVVRLGITYFSSQSQYYVDYPWGRVGLLTLIFLLVMAARAAVSPQPLAISVPFSLLLAFGTVAACYQLLNGGERAAIRDFIRRFRPTRALEPAREPSLV
jgi:O-antigen/teichoic acid export membrane protein